MQLISSFLPEGISDLEKTIMLEASFNTMDRKHTGVITFDEWLHFCLDNIEKTVANMEPHPILNNGTREELKAFIARAVVPGTPEHTELFWYILEIFIDHDADKDGNVTQYAFKGMVDKVLALPLKLDLVKNDEKQELENEDMAKRFLPSKEEIRKEQFTKYNTRGDGKMSFDEFLSFCMQKSSIRRCCISSFNFSVINRILRF